MSGLGYLGKKFKGYRISQEKKNNAIQDIYRTDISGY